MFGKPELFGSATVGERGQVVLPAELRKRFGIQAGDKLLVLAESAPDGMWHVRLVKGDVLQKMFAKMTEHLGQMMSESEKV